MPVIKLPSGKIHFLEAGQGLPVILLHANPGDSRDFDAVFESLARRFHVFALDWPGYGQSASFDVALDSPLEKFDAVLREFILERNLAPVVLIGNSVGGNVAARLAIRHTEMVAGLVLVSPGGFTQHNLVTHLFCKLQGSKLAMPPSVWARMYLKIKTRFTRAMIDRAGHEQSTPSRKQLNRKVWQAFLSPNHDLRSSAKNIDKPTLLLFGQYDPAIRAKQDGRVASLAMPNAELEVFLCGHAVFAEMPEAFLKRVVPFIERCQGDGFSQGSATQ